MHSFSLETFNNLPCEQSLFLNLHTQNLASCSPPSFLFLEAIGYLQFNLWPSILNVPSVQFSSVAQLCPTFCDPRDCSTPGLPVHHQLLELTQTHVHWVSDAIQPSHPLLSPSPPAFNLSQHPGLFQWVSPSIQVTLWQVNLLMLCFSKKHQLIISVPFCTQLLIHASLAYSVSSPHWLVGMSQCPPSAFTSECNPGLSVLPGPSILLQ